MKPTVYVAGTGIISAIGKNVPECLLALQKGQSGIDKIKYLQTNHSGVLPAGEVKLSNTELAQLCGLPANISRTAMLSLIAAQEALEQSAIQTLPALRTAFVSANTVGGMDKTEDFFTYYFNNHSKGRLKNVVNHDCGSITILVAEKLAIKNHITTISTACSSSANAIIYAARLIKHNIVDAVVAGGADALTKFTLNGFNTLMLPDAQQCKPFDENRKGLNLGEGAGYVVLVSQKVAQLLPNNNYCTISGYCNANDAYHQTASSPAGNGSFMAMSGALQMASLQPQDIGYINLHGTGTQNNDLSEGTAVQRLFQPNYPKMSSTKSYTGHTLGASAGIEAVFSTLAILHGVVYPNLNLLTPIKALPLLPETQFSTYPGLKHVLSNSFGFGGNCSSLIFTKL